MFYSKWRQFTHRPLWLPGFLALVMLLSSGPAVSADKETITPGLDKFQGVWQVPTTRGPLAQGQNGNEPWPLPTRSILGSSVPQEPQIEGLDDGDRNVYRLMTAVGREAFDNLDPRELPANNCISSGVPALAMVPNLQEWKMQEYGLEIAYESYNTIRNVYLDGREAGQVLSQLGHASAEFKDDTLVVTTINMKASGGGLSRNAPGSEQRTVTERYTLSGDGLVMALEVTVTDPLYLTRPLVRRKLLTRAPEGTIIESFPCDIEASQRYLD